MSCSCKWKSANANFIPYCGLLRTREIAERQKEILEYFSSLHKLELQSCRYHIRIEMRAGRIATFPQVAFLVYVKSVQART